MSSPRRKLYWLGAMLMIAIAGLGIVGEATSKYHSLPPEGQPQKWLRVSVGNHRLLLSWHLATPDNTGWAGQVNYWGFRYNRYTGGDGYVSMTAWYLIPVGFLLAALFAWRALRPAQIHPGFCPDCGYDLRASPDRCPECGREVFRELPDLTTKSQRPPSRAR